MINDKPTDLLKNLEEMQPECTKLVESAIKVLVDTTDLSGDGSIFLQKAKSAGFELFSKIVDTIDRMVVPLINEKVKGMNEDEVLEEKEKYENIINEFLCEMQEEYHELVEYIIKKRNEM